MNILGRGINFVISKFKGHEKKGENTSMAGQQAGDEEKKIFMKHQVIMM
ncbi:MAG: hypothetical protein Q8M08_09965 [Bacteroidales bacterium]|nr:hypothetical protein [Bacteroidales bacterium]